MTSENQTYFFEPMGDAPTVQNLRRNLFKTLCIVIVFWSVADNLYVTSHKFALLLSFAALALLVFFLFLTGKYITLIRVDPIEKMLYADYIRLSGKTGTKVIHLINVKVDYRFSFTNGYQGWILKLRDGSNSLKLRQTKSKTKKDQKNYFLKEQLDEINQLITQSK